MKKKSEILIYNLPDGSSNVEVLLNEDDIWMNKDALVSLYQTSRQNIEKHIMHIYEEGELDVNRTCNKKLQVQTEGKRQIKREAAEAGGGRYFEELLKIEKKVCLRHFINEMPFF